VLLCARADAGGMQQVELGRALIHVERRGATLTSWRRTTEPVDEGQVSSRRAVRLSGRGGSASWPVWAVAARKQAFRTQLCRCRTASKAEHDLSGSSTAEDYFLRSLDCGGSVPGNPFWTERDIVYVLQRQLSDLLQRRSGEWRVFNGHRVNPGEKPAVSADLVMVASAGLCRWERSSSSSLVTGVPT
jgi:hypothetical protein